MNRRVPDFETLEGEATAWVEQRGAVGDKINWRFTADEARIKLKRLYPSIEE